MKRNHSPEKKRGLRDFLQSSSGTVRLLICLVGIALILVVVVAAVSPVRYKLQVGMVPPSTITATKDVVDEIATERKREEAAAAVTPTYKYQEGVTEAVLADYDAIFEQLRRVHQYGETLTDISPTRNFTREELQYAQDMLTLISLRDYQVTALLRSTQEELETAYSLVYAALQSTMQKNVTEGKESVERDNIRQLVSYRISIPLGQNIVPAVLNACLRANMLIDQEATDAARQAARDGVEPVVYRQGQNIVVRGEGSVTESQLAMLSSLGLLSDGSVDITTYLGAGVLVLLVMGVLLWQLRGFRQEGVLQDTDKLLLFFAIFLSALLLCELARLANAYLAPMVVCALLCTSLLGPHPALACNVALTVLVAALCAGGSEEYADKMAHLMACGLVSGSVAALMGCRRTGRLWTLLTGLAAAAADAAVMIALGLMTATSLNGTLINAAWRAGGIIIGTLLCIGLQPLLEMIFNLPTPMKLMELSNPNQPLLRRLLLEAPGTYHHSTIVSNLAEAAAEAIGANPLLARVGGYYHDIGKLKRPSFFAENQMGGVNAHDHTDPYVSAAILTAHTKDGVALAKQYRLPKAVQDIIGEHHGNTPVMFFYHKALQMADGKPVDINAFRYDGHPPRTREGAIIMLCDTIEAAVRTMKNPTTEGIEEFIVKLVRGKLEDGQLSDCPLTLRDIDKICAAATQVLTGVFHERIEYPDMEEMNQKAQKAQMEAEEMTIERESTVSIVTPEDGTAPTVELNPQAAAPTVTPEMAAALQPVAPPPTVTPVEIDKLVTIEPLPLKETEIIPEGGEAVEK